MPERPSARARPSDQTLSRSLRGDLDQIALKALRKEPERRYLSVMQLSDDIQRHLSGEPVSARPATFRYRAVKYIKRNKAFTSAFAVFLLALTVGLIVALWQLRSSRERERVQRRELYAARLRQAGEHWATGNIAMYQEALDNCVPNNGEEDLRGFEWRYLWRLGHRDESTLRLPGELYGVDRFSGRKVLTWTSDDAVRLWDLNSDRESARWRHAAAKGAPICLEAGKIITVEDDHTMKLWDSQTGQSLLTITDRPAKITTFYSDGQRIFSGHDDGTIKLWDLASGRQVDTMRGHQGMVTEIRTAIDRRRDLRRMLTVVDRRLAQLWDLNPRRVIGAYSEGEIQILGNTASGSLFWTMVDGKTLKFRDLATGRTVGAITEPGNEILAASSQSNWDERWLVTGGKDRLVKLYDLSSLRRRAVFAGHTEWVSAFNISPDGRLLASGSNDRTVRLWDIATHSELAVLKGHVGEVGSVSFSDDGRQLISTGADSMKSWD